MFSKEYKIAVFGGISGKTSIIKRFVDGSFTEVYDPTIYEETYTKEFKVDGRHRKLEITDTPGLDEFLAFSDQDIESNQGFVLVYSLDSHKTLDHVIDLHEHITRVKGTSDVPLVLVANKCDVGEEKREVSSEVSKEVAIKFNCPLIKTSAKENICVEDVFTKIVSEIDSSKGKEKKEKELKKEERIEDESKTEEEREREREIKEYKIAVIGSGGVGKSAVIVRFIQGLFIEEHEATVYDSYRRCCEVDGERCLLEILDTAGREDNRSIRNFYMENARGFVLVYSVCSLESFEYISALHEEVLGARVSENVPMVLVGNKCDLDRSGSDSNNDAKECAFGGDGVKEPRQVTTEQGKELGRIFQCPFLETSAKDGTHIDDIFVGVVKEINVQEKFMKKKRRKNHLKYIIKRYDISNANGSKYEDNII